MNVKSMQCAIMEPLKIEIGFNISAEIVFNK